MQEGMLFHTLLAEQCGVYVQQVLAHLTDELNIAAFEQAWQRIIERHDNLRMSVNWDGSQKPLQKFHSVVEIPLEQQDWRGLPPVEQNERLNAYLGSDRAKGFALDDEAPLMRLALFKLGAADYRFVWTYHHALLDGRSRVLVLKELFTLYEALNHGNSLELEPARPYRDYISWLRTRDLSKAEAFWKNLLEGFSTPTRLAIAPPAIEESPATEHGEMQARLSRDWTLALLDLAKQNGLTLNTILQGAWALLLSRYSNQDDIVFGATRACRRSIPGETDAMVGLFINTVPVRVRLSPDDLLIPWLKALRSQHVTVRDYEHTPLVSIQSWSQLPAGTSLFESVVVFENWSLDSAFESLGGDWRNMHFSLIQQANYSLLLAAYLDSGLFIRLEYSTDLFDKTTISRMLGHFENLLASIVADPGRRISELPLMSPAERHEVLVEWNDTHKDFGRLAPLHRLFQQQVARTPDRLAVVCGDQQITYAALDRRSNQLGHYLRRLGAGAEALVGICMSRSIDMLVALLGVLKAGAAYVPLDPAYPQPRLQFILEDAQVALLLSEREMELPALRPETQVIRLEDAGQQIAWESPGACHSGVSGGNLAYLIYTSGSTGRPKGVAIEHRSAATFLQWAAEAFQGSGTEVVLASTSICFDLSVYEIFWPLSVGGRVVLTANVLETSEAGCREPIELINTVPSAISELLRSGAVPESVRVVNLAGEALSKRLVEELYRLGHVREVRNLYGPSEDTTYSTSGVMRAGAEDRVTIGRPIANTRVYIVDASGEAAPMGVAGELWIGGEGLARGYLNRPELTAEKFVPEGLSGKAGERVYQTGDVARYMSNGEIEYLGRRDQQVKIRGYRIELGEVEAVLCGHGEIREAVVMARREAGGEKRLVGYVVREGAGEELSVSELRRYLKERLPGYMVPSAFIFLERLPQTANGKLDRQALPTVRLDERNCERDYVAPRNPTEELVAGIWADILGMEQVSVFDNFFESGGHSLKAARIASRLRGAFSINLPLSTIFKTATVAGLAELIEKVVREKQGICAPPIAQIGRETTIPLSFSQWRLWFLDQLDRGNTAYNSPFALRLAGSLSVPALEASINRIIQRHESLRTCIGIVDGIPHQIISAPTRVAIPLISLERISSDKREALARRSIVQQTRMPFDLQRGSLIRVALIQLGDTDHVLMLLVHHIVFDGWSFGVFMHELATLYEAYVAGVTPILPELTIQYADYSHWQRQWLTGEIFEEQVNYWKRQLEGNTKLNLPLDSARPVPQMSVGAEQALMMPRSLAEALKELSRREGGTLFMTLLAAFQVLLFRWTGQEDISVGTPIAGRNRQELEGLIGFFVNTLVLRTDLSGDPTVTELLPRVRKVALEAYAHQDVTFEKIVQALKPKRDSGHPLFRVMFGLRTELDEVGMANLQISRMRLKTGTVKFDLSLGMADTGRGLAASLRYKAGLFEDSTISRLLKELQSLLEAMAAHPQRRLSELTFDKSKGVPSN